MFSRKQFHYAWIIVAIAAAMGFITSSMRFAAAALVPHLSDPSVGFGWSYGAISLAFSLQWIVLGLMSPYVGWLGDRYGVRRLLLLGAFLFVAGMMLTGIMGSLWQFYLFFGVVLGVSTTIFTVLPVSGVTLWFRKHLGAAMGIVWSFQGIGTIALLILIGAAFDQLGMRWIFWLPGIAGGALLLLLVRFFHNGPAEIGLRPLGDLGNEPVEKPRRDEAARIRARVFLQQAQRTPTFWNLIGIHYWGCMGHNIINILVVAIAVDRGLSLGVAAGILAAIQGVGVVTRGVVPVVAERLGCRTIWIVGMSLQAFPLLLVLFFHDAWAFYLFGRPARHRPGLRGAHLPHRQPPVLRQRPPGQPVRLAKPGQRPGHGNGARVRRVPVGLDGDLGGAPGNVLRLQPDGAHFRLDAALPPVDADPRLGKPPARQHQGSRLAKSDRPPGRTRTGILGQAPPLGEYWRLSTNLE